MRARLLALSLLLSACAYNATIRADFNPAANFAAYRTYSWIPADVPRGMNPIMYHRVQASIDRALLSRGYHQANAADFAVALTIGDKDKVDVYDWGYGGPGWGWGGWGGWGWGGPGCCWGGWWGGPYGWGYPNVDVRNYTERSIVIDFYDAKTRMPVWHGVARRDLYDPDDENYTHVDQAIDAVLAKFPPQPQPAAASGAS